MKAELKGFMIRGALLALIALGVAYPVYLSMPDLTVPPEVYGLFPFFFIMFTLFHYFLLKASSKRPQRFVAHFMGGMALKMFLALIIITVYALLNKASMVVFALTFFCLYMFYTALEIVSILKYLRGQDSD